VALDPLDSDLTTVQAVADELGGAVGVGDTRLPRLIHAASAAVLGYINADAIHYAAAFVEKVTPRLGHPRLVLNRMPIISIGSIVLADGTTLAPTDYELEDAKAGFLWRSTGWVWPGLLRGGLLYTDPDMGTERASITVTYAGGWVTPNQVASSGWSALLPRTLPFDIEEATVQAVVARYRRGGTDPEVASESMGSYSVTYRAPPVGGLLPLPASACALLDNYVRPLG
jgi:hypothetical protein